GVWPSRDHPRSQETVCTSFVSISATYTLSSSPLEWESGYGSALRDRVLSENLLRSFERLVRRRLGRHSVVDDVVPGHLKDMFGIDLGGGGTVRLVQRDRRTDQGFRDVGGTMLVAGMEPERVGLDHLRIGDCPAAEPPFQVFVKHLGLDCIF